MTQAKAIMASASFAAVGLSPAVTSTAGAAAKGAGSPLKKLVTAFKDLRDKVLVFPWEGLRVIHIYFARPLG